jgi:hypothetical protein
MKKIADFFSKWGFTVILVVVAMVLLTTLGCCIYTAVKAPFVGIIGIVGAVLSLAVVAGLLFQEITEGR